MTEDNLFTEQDSTQGATTAKKRTWKVQKGVTKEIIPNATSRRTAHDDMLDLFDVEDILDIPEYSTTQMTIDDVHRVAGTNGLRSISTFTGCGGSATGFAMAGWHELMATEFVDAARNTFASNYESTVIEPHELLELAEQWFSDNEELASKAGVRLILNKRVKVKDKVIPPSLSWERIQDSLPHTDEAREAFSEMRRWVNDQAFSAHAEEVANGKIVLWGDDIRGLDPYAMMDALGLEPGELDCFEGSPPCFPAGTRVICRDRIRPIEEVEIGHEVLTHEGRWRKVTNTMTRKSPTIILDGGRIECTPDHPFYARRFSDPGHQRDSLTAPEWIEASDMQGNFYAVPSEVQATDPTDEMPAIYDEMDHNDFWHFVGRWLGDAPEMDDVRENHASNVDFCRWLYRNFSKGAANKTLPGWVLGVDRSYKESMLRGYLDADGAHTLPEGHERYTTASRSLACGFRVLATTLGWATSTSPDIFGVGNDTSVGMADGRVVNVHRQFGVSLTKSNRYSVDEDGLRWQKMRGATVEGSKETTVYDITVDEDHSFVADGYVVHNCKSFSMAGVREDKWGKVVAYSGERKQKSDDLFFEYMRLVLAIKPRSFVAENVQGLALGAAVDHVLKPFEEEMRKAGYIVDHRLLNAADFGVPQERPRLFVQGIRTGLVDKLGRQIKPAWPKPQEYRYTVNQAISGVESTVEQIVESWLGTKEDLISTYGDIPDEVIKEFWKDQFSIKGTDSRFAIGAAWYILGPGGSPENTYFQLIRSHPDRPAPTITATSAGNIAAAGITHPHECRKFTVPELRSLFTFPGDYKFDGTTEQQGERMGRSVPPYLMKALAGKLASTLKKVHKDNGGSL
ncbi:DNA (cytosine-5-)-methyltransferase [uncultured Rothia sp.]|uniref:DNA (cytosine-5-)-methyltransferase n=1 Tax=uncultured Rothia sp. TaxID=316088 RepID=UPI0028DC3DC4|nr:DNA (cytosine-5-)-methyltransferase [uncultured Rothia sp.]